MLLGTARAGAVTPSRIRADNETRERGHVIPHSSFKNLGHPKASQVELRDNPTKQPPHIPFDKIPPDTKAPLSISPSPLTPAPRYHGFKHLTRAELDERRSKGLCFKCGPIFSPQHQCPEGQLRALLLSDDEDMDVEDPIIHTNEEGDKGKIEDEGECQILDFLGFAVTPNSSLQTLKLRGELQGIPIQILVDSGASHNFISRQLVSLLGLQTHSFAGLHICLGDGHRVRVQEKCEQLDIQLGNFSCQLEALVFE